jgi:hypothetical protein
MKKKSGKWPSTKLVANLGDFSPKNANLGIFLPFGELGDF